MVQANSTFGFEMKRECERGSSSSRLQEGKRAQAARPPEELSPQPSLARLTRRELFHMEHERLRARPIASGSGGSGRGVPTLLPRCSALNAIRGVAAAKMPACVKLGQRAKRVGSRGVDGGLLSERKATSRCQEGVRWNRLHAANSIASEALAAKASGRFTGRRHA